MTWLGLSLLLLLLCGSRVKADIEDPETNLKNFIKLLSSLNTNDVSIVYINGTVYSAIPGERSAKIFYFEGFNIARKVLRASGDYESLSCEVVVYRDPTSGQILHTWENPFTSTPNEVFSVANYPVNSLLTKNNVPFMKNLTEDRVVFNVDIPLRYPNPLPPDLYPKYSAGSFYVGAEFFEYFGRTKEVADQAKDSINVTVTWNRISQWLPWMELGQSKGNLFYSAFSWKIPSFQDFPKDLLKLLMKRYPKFFSPPTNFNIPNQTSWKVFKKVITDRREAGLPDIIFGVDLITSNSTKHRPSVDPRLISFLIQEKKFQATWSGNAYSFTEDKQSIALFHVNGSFSASIIPNGENFEVKLEAEGEYWDNQTGEVLTKWFNPFTNQTLNVPKIQIHETVTFLKDDVVSFPIPPSHEIGLSVVTSVESEVDWHTSGCMLVFSEALRRPVSYYGTYSSITNWLPWMNMTNMPGYMAFRMNVLSQKENPGP